MRKEEFIELIKEKDSQALFGLYDYEGYKNRMINPDFIKAIINELSSRDLNSDQVNSLVILISNSKTKADELNESKFSKLEIEKIMMSKWDGMSVERNYSLQKLSDRLNISAYFVLFLIISTALYALIMDQVLIGILIILSGGISVLLLIVLSKLIHVFLDIEYNTRG